MTTEIRPRRGMYGGAHARRMMLIDIVEGDTYQGIHLVKYHHDTGQYSFKLPTGELLTIDKQAVVPFCCGIYAAAGLAIPPVDSLLEAFDEVLQIDDLTRPDTPLRRKHPHTAICCGGVAFPTVYGRYR